MGAPFGRINPLGGWPGRSVECPDHVLSLRDCPKTQTQERERLEDVEAEVQRARTNPWPRPRFRSDQARGLSGERQSYTATASFGGSFAPVMKATASDIV